MTTLVVTLCMFSQLGVSMNSTHRTEVEGDAIFLISEGLFFSGNMSAPAAPRREKASSD